MYVWATFPVNFIKFWGGGAGNICWIDMQWPRCLHLSPAAACISASNLVRLDTSRHNGKVGKTMEVSSCGQSLPGLWSYYLTTEFDLPFHSWSLSFPKNCHNATHLASQRMPWGLLPHATFHEQHFPHKWYVSILNCLNVLKAQNSPPEPFCWPSIWKLLKISPPKGQKMCPGHSSNTVENFMSIGCTGANISVPRKNIKRNSKLDTKPYYCMAGKNYFRSQIIIWNNTAATKIMRIRK